MHEQDIGRALRSRGLKQADVTAASRLIGVDKTHAAHLLVELTHPSKRPTIGSVIRDARLRENPGWVCYDTRGPVVLEESVKIARLDAAIEVFNHLF